MILTLIDDKRMTAGIRTVNIIFQLRRLLSSVALVLLLLLVSGCISGSGGDGNTPPSGTQQPGDTGGTGNTGTGGSSNSPGGDTGTGGSNTGGGSTGGTGGSGSTGGDTGGTGTTTPTPIYGSFSTLYTAASVDLTLSNCSNPSSGTKTFQTATFRALAQHDNHVEAAITLIPNVNYLSEFDQVFVNLSGDFHEDGSFTGPVSAIIYSLGGTILSQGSGEVIITTFTTTIIVELIASTSTPECSLTGTFLLSVAPDPTNPGTGTGGDTGGNTGGGTGGTGGGDTGSGTGGTGGTGGSGGTGGTGGTGSGTLIVANGQFGNLQFTSTDHPEDSGSFDMTTALYVASPGLEYFAWTNPEQATVNIYFLDDVNNPSGTTFDSANGRGYTCRCFPAVDLVNNAVTFNNLQLSTQEVPSASITINGVVNIPAGN